jgi:subtilisin family serine protease
MNWIHIIGLLALALITIGPLALAVVRSGEMFGDPIACNTAGTHAAGITRSAEAAIGTPHLLLTKGTADNEVNICGADDMPLGTAADVVAIDEQVGVHLLAGGGQTILMVAGEAIDVGEEVYTAANGKVTDLSAVAGTYYKVGTALTKATADGDEIEVMPCYPVATVVSE